MSEEKRILLRFVTKYYTEWGQNVVVSGDGVLFGNYDIKRAHWASCHHVGRDLVWEVVVPIPLVPEITYRYAVVDEALNVIKWTNETHCVNLPSSLEDGSIIEIYDEWMDNSHPANILATCAFTKVILPNRPQILSGSLKRINSSVNEAIVRFQVWDWEVQDGQEICVTGGVSQLGNWQMQQVLRMTQSKRACWETEISVPLNAFPVTYKYAVGKQGDERLLLEHGESRIAALSMTENSRAPAMLIQHDGYFRRERRWRGAGVAIPVFSLRSNDSIGCGEFADIPLLAKWCADVGLNILQILPVVDTSVSNSWRDSYPYSSLCVCALHPMYLRLSLLADEFTQEIKEDIERVRTALDLPEVDYEATMKAKLGIARAVFNLCGQETLKSDEYRIFWEENRDWLRPYSVFCFLRDLFGTSEHWKWGVFSQPTPEVLHRISSESTEWHQTIKFHCYLQFHLHRQLKSASLAAAALKVALKGDLPIGVDKRSVDTWLAPHLFRMNKSTGAPPDYFDPKGQNWGFPTYNWEEMALDDNRWWKRRLLHMSQYFHAYRIDHILGFFRIWELDAQTRMGILGQFRPGVPFWRHELEASGIWDIDRLCDPYVTPSVLERVFGDKETATEIEARYFVEGPNRRLSFRKQYASEAALFAIRARRGVPQEIADEINSTREKLLKLLQNVLLIKDPEHPDRFVPRFDLAATSSFRELDVHTWKEELVKMHDDYYHRGRSDVLWRGQALRTLPVLQGATDMLVCGEDLGMIPSCVHPVMEELGIIGLRIQRMPSELGVEFDNVATYPYMTVASPSSHDTSTLRGWYESDAERRRRYFLKVLGGDDACPPEKCTPNIAETVILQHLNSPSVLAIFPMQDLMALSASFATRPADEETINDPTNPEHYWRYRMHISLDKLNEDEVIKEKIKNLMLLSGRGA